MAESKRIAIGLIDRDDQQPRKHFDEGELLALGENMRAFRQLVSVILYVVGKRLVLLDGERRWRAAQLVGITELDAVVLDERPTAAALHVLQMSLEAHKVGLSAMERSNLLVKIREENSWSVTELAAKLHLKQPLVSKLLKFQTLDPSIQTLLHAGELDTEKAFIISQEPDLEKQRELVKQAASLSREQLRTKAKAIGQIDEPKAGVATFKMPGGFAIGVRGPDLSLSLTIQLLQETARLLKKGLAESRTLAAQQRIMRDAAAKAVNP